MTDLTVETVDVLVALEGVTRRLAAALAAYASSMLAAAGEPVDQTEALGLVVAALTRVLERQGFDEALASRAVFNAVSDVLLSVYD